MILGGVQMIELHRLRDYGNKRSTWKEQAIMLGRFPTGIYDLAYTMTNVGLLC